jgi:glycosyltransferase involved in cell wall biosynthesis
MTSLGHEVDLVTYPFGHDVQIPGLRVFRSLRPPFVDSVKIGPSAAKIPLDILLSFSALRRALSGRYDAVHSHEEGGLIGIVLSAILRVPHLYDMHSSLPQQLSNFAFSRSSVLLGAFRFIERIMIRRSRVVIVICPSLEETVKAIEPAAHVVLIENAPGSGEEQASETDAAAVRAQWGLAPNTPLVLYTGTFEAYQGLDLLFAAMVIVKQSRPDARLLLAGGKPDQVARAVADARAAGIGDVTIFAGERPAAEIPAYLLAADVLTSPRSKGTNTPLKIYQYLRSGKPIVATRLLTHTQVLDDETAMLTAPDANAFGAGILAMIDDPAAGGRLGRNARVLAETKYSYEAYLDRTRRACRALASPPGSAATVKDVA